MKQRATNYIINYYCSKKYQFAIIFCHYANEEFRDGLEAIPKNTRVLHGKVHTPIYDHESNQTVKRELVRTALGIRSLMGTALNWGYFHTLEMMDKPDLYHSLIKQGKFSLRALMNLKDQRAGRPHQPRTKEELERILERMKMPIRKHAPRREYLKSSLLITKLIFHTHSFLMF